jgi:uncharacterized protein
MSTLLRHVASHRSVLFSIFTTLLFIACIVVTAIIQKMASEPIAQEALGAVGRTAIGLIALACIATCGWFSWLANSGSRTSWLFILAPLLYVLGVYPLLFSGAYELPAEDRSLLSMVAANGFAAGVMEELIFRGLVLGALLSRWGVTGSGLWRALVVSSLLFSAPHALNILSGAQLLTTIAQLVWALQLGIVFGALVVAGGSVWPVAALHGLSNAYIHANRFGLNVTIELPAATLLALAPVPLVLYSWALLKRTRRLPAAPVVA